MVEPLPSKHDSDQRLSIAHFRQRVVRDQEQICSQADFDPAELICPIEERRGVARTRRESLVRAQAGIDQVLQLQVGREAGEPIVRSEENSATSVM